MESYLILASGWGNKTQMSYFNLAPPGMDESAGDFEVNLYIIYNLSWINYLAIRLDKELV